MNRTALLAALPLAFAVPAWGQEEAEPVTPASIVAASAPEEWVEIDPDHILVMRLADNGSDAPRDVVIQLLPEPFSQPWVENIRTLARAHWWDGTSVYRVVDNWVAQWGGGDPELDMDPGPMPDGVLDTQGLAYPSTASDLHRPLVEEYLQNAFEGIVDSRIAWLDGHAGFPRTGYYADLEVWVDGWPISAGDGGETVWPVHCYAHVGVARDLAPDTGTGSELYAVIGHAPRQLDRNIAVVGRVIEGIEHLSTLPRGTGDAGVYEDRAEDTPIEWVRLASDVEESEHWRYEYLDTTSDSFAAYVANRANRHDAFYEVPAGGVDICNVQVPIRQIPAE
ncbi:peptidylprolyl isomerase [Alteraurantiacibacter aquimixticola]|uniref:Peptidylprolyl isomerase n=1 Tax=Alteraurantiacibacter aquimixticola TaxID=2489173 RepID=A0A4T3F4Z6_9SPHN|nr:peptidylprolyl isomerase [Alteraurantiacibacter aquimixticola]TIX49803.1 peptidylprolyl isomerase [Alteraurantiacibacter aquimixticola]